MGMGDVIKNNKFLKKFIKEELISEGYRAS